MRTADFDFDLPEERIALEPAEPRDTARLLVIRGRSGVGLEDRRVLDLPDLLRPGDALVVNDTRVIPAALAGRRIRGDLEASLDFTLLKRTASDRWQAFARPAKRLKAGDRIVFGSGSLLAEVVARGDAGEVELAFDRSDAALDAALAEVGTMPLPPYIALKRDVTAADEARYQTLFAAKDGAVAAPTAGLHFTARLLDALTARGVTLHRVTLHVGAGTFLPVKAETIAEHRMHSEWCAVSPETADALNTARARGSRIVAVGTTALRTLESAADEAGLIRPFSAETAIFITPGYRFRAVDVLMTNFHLPRSTLFMLVAAFSGLETMHQAYDHAIREQYRFYSYGDACLLLPGG